MRPVLTQSLSKSRGSNKLTDRDESYQDHEVQVNFILQVLQLTNVRLKFTVTPVFELAMFT